MAKVSSSFLDAMIRPQVTPLYVRLRIPKRFPPEGIVVAGHLFALAAGFFFAYSQVIWWCGPLAACCVLFNQVLDMLDGAHARATGQCRNSGELLDHLLGPLGYAYWVIGLSVSSRFVTLAIPGLVILYSIVTISHMIHHFTGEFRLSRFGPTEFRAVMFLYGLTLPFIHIVNLKYKILSNYTFLFSIFLILVYALNLFQLLWSAIRRVNTEALPPDTSEWILVANHAQTRSDSPLDKTG
jgi:archaetidylinositol phosphate synthase